MVAAGVTSVADEGLTPNSTYSYEVQAANAGGTSATSAPGSGATWQQTLEPPTQVTGHALNGSTIQICWMPSAPDLGAVVGREADGEAEPQILGPVPAGQTCYDDETVYPWSFRYFVKHVSGQNESAWAMSNPIPALGDLQKVMRSGYLPLIRK